MSGEPPPETGIVVALMGARQHYAVPRVLESAGLLRRLFVDSCAVKGFPRLLGALPRALQPRPLQRLLGRVPEGVPPERIRAFNLFGLEYARRQARARGALERTRASLWAGRRFCELTRAALGNELDAALYVVHLAGLELLLHARRHGRHAVYEQTIAPHAVSHPLLNEERARHPSWGEAPEPGEVAELIIEREQREWEHATLIVCGSEFVREGIAGCGGPAGRCAVVPYGTDPRFAAALRPRPHGGPLRVLTVGEVGLRKGSPYVLAAAQRLGDAARFRMVGAVQASLEARGELEQRVELCGAVPRHEMLDHYAWADVLLLPSLCEGSAGVTYEALAAGLPVVATPNTGSLVRDGEDGYLVPIRDADTIAERLERLARSPDLHRELCANARARLHEVTFPGYGERLVARLSAHLRERLAG